MEAFEQLISEIFWMEGYWARNSVKVNLTEEEKVKIGRVVAAMDGTPERTMPRRHRKYGVQDGGKGTRRHGSALQIRRGCTDSAPLALCAAIRPTGAGSSKG